MRTRFLVVLCGLMLAVVAACTSAVPTPPPAAPAAPPQQVVGTLNQVMRGILFPNSNIIFDAQDRDPGAEVDPADAAAAAHPFAGTYGGWQSVENAAIALSEAANLVSLPGRTCQNGKPVPLEDDVFQNGLKALRETSAEAYQIAQAKDMSKIVDLSDKLTRACSTCHDVYRDKIVDGKPIAMADRCVK